MLRWPISQLRVLKAKDTHNISGIILWRLLSSGSLFRRAWVFSWFFSLEKWNTQKLNELKWNQSESVMKIHFVLNSEKRSSLQCSLFFQYYRFFWLRFFTNFQFFLHFHNFLTFLVDICHKFSLLLKFQICLSTFLVESVKSL